MIEWIRFAIAAILMILALGSFIAAVTGAYRFGFVMNRMHAAGIGDTAGIFLVILSLAVALGPKMSTWKLLILVFFLWFTSPVSTHFLGQVEYKNTMMMILLVVCAIGVNFGKSLLQAVIIFMSYSSIMCILWVLLESPDLAITEAAVGAGVSSVLFMLTLRRIRTEDLRLEALETEAHIAEVEKMKKQTGTEQSAKESVTEK